MTKLNVNKAEWRRKEAIIVPTIESMNTDVVTARSGWNRLLHWRLNPIKKLMDSSETMLPRVKGMANFAGLRTIEGTFIVDTSERTVPIAKHTKKALNRWPYVISRQGHGL